MSKLASQPILTPVNFDRPISREPQTKSLIKSKEDQLLEDKEEEKMVEKAYKSIEY